MACSFMDFKRQEHSICSPGYFKTLYELLVKMTEEFQKDKPILIIVDIMTQIRTLLDVKDATIYDVWPSAV